MAGNGTSSLGELLVVDHPVVVETSKAHGTQETATRAQSTLSLPESIRAKEEVDQYRFKAEAGQEITFSLMAQRLYFKRHYQEGGNSDPMLILTDPSGQELAHPTTITILAIRCFIIGLRTRVSISLRCATLIMVESLTSRTRSRSRIDRMRRPSSRSPSLQRSMGRLRQRVRNPRRSTPALRNVHSTHRRTSCSPARLERARDERGGVRGDRFADPLGDRTEQRSRGGQSHPAYRRGAQRPRGSGERRRPLRVPPEGGAGCPFRGQGQALGSSLDSHLRLIDAKGSIVASGDDTPRSKDAILTYNPSAAGAYTLEVRDLLYRGGPTYGYCIVVDADEPDFEVTCDDDKAGVGPGGAVPWFVRATRRAGFDGPIEVRVEGVPPGLTAQPVTIPPTMTDGCLILQAAADAKPTVAPVKVMASASVKGRDGKTRKVEHRVQPLQELYMGGGGRNVWPVETQVAQIVVRDDIAAVRVSPATISIKPGEQVILDVDVTRRPGFKGRVTLDTKLQHLGRVFGNPLPPGVTLVETGSKTTLSPEESKGRLILKARPDAKPVEHVSIAVFAFVSIDFVVKRATQAPSPSRFPLRPLRIVDSSVCAILYVMSQRWARVNCGPRPHELVVTPGPRLDGL